MLLKIIRNGLGVLIVFLNQAFRPKQIKRSKEDQAVVIPPWAGLELTNLRGWSNASLSTMIKDSEQN